MQRNLMQSLMWTLSLLAVTASCTPEELIAIRDQQNPNDPSIDERPIESLVASRLHGSNFNQKIISTGFGANGHSQSWDGRILD